jgi:FAD dependent oxidoreductase
MKYFIEGERKIPIIKECDVVVSGGGPSGIAAAISCSRLGVKTLLIEKNGWVGGMATSGLVHPFMPSYAGDHMINKGLFLEIVKRLLEQKAAIHPGTTKMGTGYSGYVVWPHASVTPFDVEVLKWILQDLIEEASVDLLLHSHVVGGISESDKTTGVIIESKSGRMAIKSKIVIDATGDGDLAKFLDIPFKKGSDNDNNLQPATLFFRLGGVNRKIVDSYIEKHPEERHFQSFAKIAKEKGEFIDTKHDVLFFYTPREDEVAVNTTRIHGIDGTNVVDLTRAELECRKQIRILVKFFKKYVPGFENSYITTTAQEIGIRESRRVVGEYTLTRDDLLSTRQFPDNIAQSSYMIDIHDRESTDLFYTPIPEGKSYGIPYRCLVPIKMENILFAGRCISSTQEAQGSLRVMPPAFSIGQAAGTAAALAVKHNVFPRNLDINLLRQELLKSGQVID